MGAAVQYRLPSVHVPVALSLGSGYSQQSCRAPPGLQASMCLLGCMYCNCISGMAPCTFCHLPLLLVLVD